MSLPKTKFQEMIFLLLYSHDTGRANDQDMIPLLMAELAVTKKSVLAAQDYMKAVLLKIPEIDQLIIRKVKSYEFERIQSVERNLLRLGIYQILYDSSIPPKVAIAETLRMTKKFSSPESVSFVNAIIDSIYQETIPPQLSHGPTV